MEYKSLKLLPLMIGVWSIFLTLVASRGNTSEYDGPLGSTSNGDFMNPRKTRITNWRVTDSTGLNCRMAGRFQNVTYADANVPDELYKDFIQNIGSWEVVHEFSYQENLNAITAHLRNPAFLYDRNRNPWMAVSYRSGQSGMCFVRANVKYILPIWND